MTVFSKFAAIAAIAASSAVVAGAQGVTNALKPISLGISGGASIPTGDLSDGVNTGYNVGGHIALATPSIPISFRGDVNYDNFGAKRYDSFDAGGLANSDTHIWSYMANAEYEVPTMTGIRPYIIGGVGAFNAASSTKFGFDVGGGLTIPLSGFNAFVEARYNHFNNNNGGGSTSFIPVTFGVMF